MLNRAHQDRRTALLQETTHLCRLRPLVHPAVLAKVLAKAARTRIAPPTQASPRDPLCQRLRPLPLCPWLLQRPRQSILRRAVKLRNLAVCLVALPPAIPHLVAPPLAVHPLATLSLQTPPLPIPRLILRITARHRQVRPVVQVRTPQLGQVLSNPRLRLSRVPEVGSAAGLDCRYSLR